MSIHRSALLAASLCFAAAAAPAQLETPDIPIATVSGRTLFVDLYFPQSEPHNAPLVVWIHGGGWVSGNRKRARTDARHLASLGFAVAAIEYRLSLEAVWPAQIHDCKCAVRWLRGKAQVLGIDPWNFIACGESAGGQLAAVLATSGGSGELEGTVGGNLEQSSRVQGAVSLMAPHDFFSLSGYHLDPISFESVLLGAPLGQVQLMRGNTQATVYEWRANTASSVRWLDRSDPAMLLGHGLLDPIYDWTQSDEAYRRALGLGIDARLMLDENAGHAIPASMYAQRDAWLRQVTRPNRPVRTFGRGIAVLEGDEPAIAARSSGGTVTITLDHAPPGATAIALLGRRLGGGGAVPYAAQPTPLLFTPLTATTTTVGGLGRAAVTIPAPAPGTSLYCQWGVVYIAADRQVHVATSGGVQLQ